jgi:hypothetical protein
MRVSPIRFALLVQLLFPLYHAPFIIRGINQFQSQLIVKPYIPIFLFCRLYQPFHGQELTFFWCDWDRDLVPDTSSLDRCQTQNRLAVVHSLVENYTRVQLDRGFVVVVLAFVVLLQLDPFDIFKCLFYQTSCQDFFSTTHGVINEKVDQVILGVGARLVIEGCPGRHMDKFLHFSRFFQLLLSLLFVDRFDVIAGVLGHSMFLDKSARECEIRLNVLAIFEKRSYGGHFRVVRMRLQNGGVY